MTVTNRLIKMKFERERADTHEIESVNQHKTTTKTD